MDEILSQELTLSQRTEVVSGNNSEQLKYISCLFPPLVHLTTIVGCFTALFIVSSCLKLKEEWGYLKFPCMQ